MPNLAQVNVARFRWPLDDPRMREFANRIDEIIRVAENSAGFIWRFDGDYDGSSYPSPWNDELIFFNMSVWRDVDTLRKFVFSTPHIELIQRRAKWVEPLGGPLHVMWWVNDGVLPTVSEAVNQLQRYEEGTSNCGFTFADSQGRQTI